MSRQLEGRVAVVTGAGRGIGRATAVALAREGADVACVARTASQLAETAALVRAAGRRAQQIEADIGEPGAPSLIAAKVLAELGTIDILVNNAATVEPAGPTATAAPEDWARAVAANLTGPVRLTLAVLGGMIEQGYGRIVNLSSAIAAAPGAIPGLNAYGHRQDRPVPRREPVHHLGVQVRHLRGVRQDRAAFLAPSRGPGGGGGLGPAAGQVRPGPGP
jgi:NAD(P)-dependent dehydrogenase (short-subunit alcohol dehydrogenase family)